MLCDGAKARSMRPELPDSAVFHLLGMVCHKGRGWIVTGADVHRPGVGLLVLVLMYPITFSGQILQHGSTWINLVLYQQHHCCTSEIIQFGCWGVSRGKGINEEETLPQGDPQQLSFAYGVQSSWHHCITKVM